MKLYKRFVLTISAWFETRRKARKEKQRIEQMVTNIYKDYPLSSKQFAYACTNIKRFELDILELKTSLQENPEYNSDLRFKILECSDDKGIFTCIKRFWYEHNYSLLFSGLNSKELEICKRITLNSMGGSYFGIEIFLPH